MRKFFCFLSILFFTLASPAMRIPTALTKGVIDFKDGFSIDSTGTNWVRTKDNKDNQQKIEAMFKQSSTTFSIRIDKETQLKSLDEYANKWLNTYGQFGLEVLGHQFFKSDGDSRGLVVDLINSHTNKKMRQAIFFRSAKAIVLTCIDDAKNFDAQIKNCNQLIKTFNWTDDLNPKAPINQLQSPQG